jgi:cytidylate kinase
MNPNDIDKNKLKGLVIAIDGPAGSGKSTTAKILAEKLGYVYLDTGAMYRALTLEALRNNVAPSNVAKLTEMARALPLRFAPIDGVNRVFIGDEDVTTQIRNPETTRIVSEISAHREVRLAMVEKQKAMGKNGSIVAEGRDTTTVVFPDADIKIYMDASVEERARRRVLDMKAMGIETTIAEQITEINRRDGLDSNRAHSPLRQAIDAVVVDTTRLTIDGEVNRILQLVHETVRDQ